MKKQRYEDLSEYDPKFPRRRGTIHFCDSIGEWNTVIKSFPGCSYDKERKIVVVYH